MRTITVRTLARQQGSGPPTLREALAGDLDISPDATQPEPAPEIDDDVICQLRDAGIIPTASRCDAMTPDERAIASADLVLEFAERDLAKAQELEAHGNDHDQRADEASDRYKRLPGLAAACDAKDHAELAAEARRQARERLESAERLTAMASAIRERAEARHEAFLIAARQGRVTQLRASHVPQRSTSRAPRRRVSRSAAAATRAGPAKGDDPDPEPSSRVLVCQKTAPAVLGWTGRRYIGFLRRKRVPHVVDARLFVARLDDVLTALGLDAPSAAKVEAIVGWRARAELKLVGGSRGAR
jgi:hypothetical protein